jgi:hypothetical protein
LLSLDLGASLFGISSTLVIDPVDMKGVAQIFETRNDDEGNIELMMHAAGTEKTKAALLQLSCQLLALQWLITLRDKLEGKPPIGLGSFAFYIKLQQLRARVADGADLDATSRACGLDKLVYLLFCYVEPYVHNKIKDPALKALMLASVIDAADRYMASEHATSITTSLDGGELDAGAFLRTQIQINDECTRLQYSLGELCEAAQNYKGMLTLLFTHLISILSRCSCFSHFPLHVLQMRFAITRGA